MVLRYLLAMCLMVVLPGVAMSANSLRYEAPMTNAQWTTVSSPLVCRLRHDIGLYGHAEFVRYAGREIFLRLNTDQGGPRNGYAELRALGPVWKVGAQANHLGKVRYRGGRDAFRFSRLQVRKILASLEQGQRPSVHYHSVDSGADEVEVVISSIRFKEELRAFRSCMNALIQLDYESASQSRIQFSAGKNDLDKKARRRLESIAAFVHADKDIKQIRIEGYSDNVGTRGDNYALSRLRALKVKEYLEACNVPAQKISFDYFGEHRPVSSNRTAKGRALNRRVEVSFIK